MTTAEYKAIFDDLGLSINKFGLMARQDTLEYLRRLDGELPEEHIECAASTYFQGTYDTLNKYFAAYHALMGFDVSQQKDMPNPHRLVTEKV
jgi:hypothetical protein